MYKISIKYKIQAIRASGLNLESKSNLSKPNLLITCISCLSNTLFVVLRRMRIVEQADRIPFPISRGCDLPMVSFFPIWKSCGLGGM